MSGKIAQYLNVKHCEILQKNCSAFLRYFSKQQFETCVIHSSIISLKIEWFKLTVNELCKYTLTEMGHLHFDIIFVEVISVAFHFIFVIAFLLCAHEWMSSH